MFTGIITHIGELVAREGGQFEIVTGFAPDTVALGASVACDGCCLTVTDCQPHPKGARLSFDVSNETMSKTTLGDWKIGAQINLERALRAGEELGGHFVTGHVDSTARIVDINSDGESQKFDFEVGDDVAHFIAQKGSVALDGTSLTVNATVGNRFSVNLIPHTLTHTTWGRKKSQDHVNLEVDLFARYVARMMEFSR